MKAPPRAMSRAKQTEPPRRRRRLRALVIGLLCLTFFFVAAWFALYFFVRVPAPTEIATSQSTVVLDQKGRPVGRLHAATDRIIVPFDQMPEILRKAVIAAEDHGFYSHHGVSPTGIIRAAVDNIVHARIRAGGSTITQQYVKNAFVGRERTFWRKIKEAAIALKLERTRTKDQILEAYLNTIYFGRGAYGIESAARTYYGKAAIGLTLDQAAVLAGIIRAPETLDPTRNPTGAKRRRDVVLRQMVSLGMISSSDAEAAIARKVVVTPRGSLATGEAPYFLEDVRRELVQRFGSSAVNRNGLRVTTTLDITAQRAAEAAVRGVLDRPDDPAAALVAIDPKTGGVRALVGGRDYAEKQYDIATHRPGRQPGSAFKPFVLAAWLETGHSLTDTLRAPATITLPGVPKPWTVSNYDKHDYGSISVLRATQDSVNTVYAQMIRTLTPSVVRAMAVRAGITSPISPVAGLALGTEEVTPIELAAAYATFAAGGMRPPVHMIARVTDAKGNELYRFSAPRVRVIPASVAASVSFALDKVVAEGTGRRAAFGRPAAGKTGTTENHRDAWFAGYTPDLAAVAWMGYADGTRTMEHVRGVAVVGGSFPARIWRAFMSATLAHTPPKAFPSPPHPAASPSPSPSPAKSPSLSPSPSPVLSPTPSPKPSAS